MAKLFDLEPGYMYTRLANPTNDAVANKIACLEGGVGAMLTSSGQAANFYAVFNICEAGDHIVTSKRNLRRNLQPVRRNDEEARHRVHLRQPRKQRGGNTEGFQT